MSTIEEVEMYWSRSPCNIRHSKSPVGSAAWSSQVTARKYFIEPHIPAFAQFERWHDKRVLEIGCGIGTDTLEFCRAGVLHIDAVDISSQSLTLAFNRVASEGFTNAAFHRQNAEEKLPVNRYDLVYSFGVLHHTPNPKFILDRTQEVLKGRGELRVMLYAKWSVKNLLRQQPEAQPDCPIAKFYSAWEARNLLWASGFKIISIRKTHIFPWRVREYVKHEYVKEWPYRLLPKWMFGILERLLGHHLLIVAVKA